MPAPTQEQVVGIRRSGVTGVAVNGHQFRVVCRPVAAPGPAALPEAFRTSGHRRRAPWLTLDAGNRKFPA